MEVNSPSHDNEAVTHCLLITYDGLPYQGWQRQGELPTVQLKIEKALSECWKQPVIINGSGRTDTGVHGLGQVATFQMPPRLKPEVLREALNNKLPESIRIRETWQMPNNFHARFSATGKQYEYRIFNDPVGDPFLVDRTWHLPRPLNFEAMQEAAAHFIGEHDFSSFASNPGYQRHSMVRKLYTSELSRDSETPQLIRYQVSGSGFLYRMVRNIMGAIVRVGQGRMQAAEIPDILAKQNRSAAPNTAPACGLYLKEVYYDQHQEHFPPHLRRHTQSRCHD